MNGRPRRRRDAGRGGAALATLALAAIAVAAAAPAQKAFHTLGATQPGAGRSTVLEQVHWLHAGDLDELALTTTFVHGLRHDLALGLDVPVAIRFRDGASEGDFGDLRLLGSWRFHRRDSGPIDTTRAAVFAGLQFDTASDDAMSLQPGFRRDSFDPILGAAWTRVHGRAGLDASADYTLSTSGRADDLRYNGAWLFRAAPAEFTAGSEDAIYAVLELDGRYETNGDHELLFTPGVLYEARRVTVEAAVQLPLLQDLDHRPELDFGLVLGLRLVF